MLVRLALALNPEHVRPVVVCLKEAGIWAEPLKERGIPVYERQLRHKFDVGVIHRLSHLVRRYEPACLLAVGSGGDRMFWSTLAGWRMKVPVIVWSHIFPSPGRLAFEWVNRRLYGHVDAFVALGEQHREALVALEGVPADRVTVIRNGIDVDGFDGEGDRAAVRAELGAAADDVVVGIVANLRPDKRHDVFVKAAAQVRLARPATRFVIIGDGPGRGKVQQMVAACDPDGVFLRMLGERGDVRALMQGLDVVCLTSEWQECLSVVMLEAMAAGKTFVAPRVGSLDEALIDGVTGRFFGPLRADALAAVLIELVDDAEQRQSLGVRARDRVREEFTAMRMAQHFTSLVLGLCR